MIQQWKALLEERATDWNLPGGGSWNSLLLNYYYPQGANIILLWFHNGGKFPQVVTKLCTEESVLTHEFQNLKSVYSHVPTCVPRPLDLVKQGRYLGLWMEAVPGICSLLQDYRPPHLREVAEMLADVHRGLRNDSAEAGWERYRRMVLDPLATLAQLGSAPAVLKGCAELRSRISTEWLDSLPVIPQHGDLFPGNLLVHEGRWRMVDWESFGIVDFPFYDLLTLLIALLTAGGEILGGWDQDLVRQIPGLIERYAQNLGLNAETVSLLLPLTLANWIHLQWCDGRKKFTDRMYQTFEHYFEHPDRWQQVFRCA